VRIIDSRMSFLRSFITKTNTSETEDNAALILSLPPLSLDPSIPALHLGGRSAFVPAMGEGRNQRSVIRLQNEKSESY
jgi:hypothetical protein